MKYLYKTRFKRFLDLVLSALGILVVWPLFLVIFVILRISLGSPAIFRHERPGRGGRLFTMYKFRTMTNDKGDDGRLLPDEQRITRIGNRIRRLSLDELPEIVNVLKGDMSLVGPRPLLVEYLGRYSPEQSRRHQVRPGITGWAQVHGRNAISWEEKLRLDVWYVDNLSLSVDLRILFMTVMKVLRREGISEDGFVSASLFMGTGAKESEQGQ